jgi:hypothetical protein
MATKKNKGKVISDAEAELNAVKAGPSAAPAPAQRGFFDPPDAPAPSPAAPAPAQRGFFDPPDAPPMRLSQRLSEGASEVERLRNIGDYEGARTATSGLVSTVVGGERYNYETNQLTTPLNREEQVLMHHWNKGAETNQWKVQVPGLQYLDPSDPQNKTILDKVTTDLYDANKAASKAPTAESPSGIKDPNNPRGYLSPGHLFSSSRDEINDPEKYKQGTLEAFRFYKGEEGIYGVPKYFSSVTETTHRGIGSNPGTFPGSGVGGAVAPLRFNQEGELVSFGAATNKTSLEGTSFPDSRQYPSSLAPTPATPSSPAAPAAAAPTPAAPSAPAPALEPSYEDDKKEAAERDRVDFLNRAPALADGSPPPRPTSGYAEQASWDRNWAPVVAQADWDAQTPEEQAVRQLELLHQLEEDGVFERHEAHKRAAAERAAGGGDGPVPPGGGDGPVPPGGGDGPATPTPAAAQINTPTEEEMDARRAAFEERAAAQRRQAEAADDDFGPIPPDPNRRRNRVPDVIDDRPESEKAEDGRVPEGLEPESEEAKRKATAARELAERKARIEEAKKADIPESDYEGRRTLERDNIAKRFGKGVGGSVVDLAVGTLAGALIGGASAGMSYDSEKESDPYLKPFRIIGRATAILGGAVEGGMTGLATAGIAKMTQGLGGLIAGDSSSENFTTSFIRGFRSLSGKTAAQEGIGGAGRKVSEGLEEIPYVAFARNQGIDKELKKQAGRIKRLEADGSPEALKKAEEGKKLLESARNRALRPDQRESLRQNQFGLLLRDAPNVLAFGAGVVTAAPFATMGAVKNLHNDHIKEKFPGIFRKESFGGMDAEFWNSMAPKNMIQDPKAILNGRLANASGAALYNVGMATIGATTLFGMATAPFTAGFESSGMAGNANHPFNVIRNGQDPGATARAQMEADAANKVKMTKPNMIGLSDIDEAYFTNQSFRPTRGRHAPGKYNDDGNLVFALSALRRG